MPERLGGGAMKHRTVLTVVATVGLLAAACSSGATTAPAASTGGGSPVASATSPSSAPSASAGATGGPSANLPQSIGKGEGSLNIIVWPGYAEDGSNVKEYDWVHPFEAANPDCGKVNVKPADTSDELGRRLRSNRVEGQPGQDHRLRQPDLHRRRGALPQDGQPVPRDHGPVRADPTPVRCGRGPADRPAACLLYT